VQKFCLLEQSFTAVQVIIINHTHFGENMERIPLDQPTLKALAGETRVRILKMLDKKSMTQTDLAGFLRMSLPTIGEHLRALEQAELVEREQTERKWKYYSLTSKSRLLLHPHTTTIWFVLGLFLFSAAATIINAIRYFTPVAEFGGVLEMRAAAPEAQALAAPAMAADAAAAAPAAIAPSPVWLILFGCATIVLLVALVRLLHSHGWLGKSLSNKKNI
jgi:DNA-binding transcriptional ArsR family regulator